MPSVMTELNGIVLLYYHNYSAKKYQNCNNIFHIPAINIVVNLSRGANILLILQLCANYWILYVVYSIIIVC